MTPFLRQPRAPFLIAAVAGVGLVIIGVLMVRFLRLSACPLCIIQRMLYLVLALAAAGGLALVARPVGRRLAALLCALIAGTGAFVAGYQVWLQRFAADQTCSSGYPWWERLVDWAGERWPLFFLSNGLCSDPEWKFLGLSIADYSFLIFSALLILFLWTALRRR
jgi:disulfide bond formation protein DsbB